MAKFDFANRQISQGKDTIVRFCLWEKQFSSYKLVTKLNWEKVKADKGNSGKLKKKTGVYAFVVKPDLAFMDWSGYILYIGMTKKQDFPTRFKQYFNEPNKKKPRFWVSGMFERWENNLYYYYAPTDKPEEVENALLTALLPPYNERFPGDLSKIKKEIYR